MHIDPWAEEARRNKRTIDRAGRTVDRERVKLQNNEKKLLSQIKALAKQNKHVHQLEWVNRNRTLPRY